jgi:hypothetical protein
MLRDILIATLLRATLRGAVLWWQVILAIQINDTKMTGILNQINAKRFTDGRCVDLATRTVALVQGGGSVSSDHTSEFFYLRCNVFLFPGLAQYLELEKHMGSMFGATSVWPAPENLNWAVLMLNAGPEDVANTLAGTNYTEKALNLSDSTRTAFNLSEAGGEVR